jgi:hypothetical protein
MTKDVSKAYELNLEEIAEASDQAKIAFFTQPMLVPLLATSAHARETEHFEETMKSITNGEIVVGLTRDKNMVVEPIALFTKIVVTDGEAKDR